MYTQIKNQIQSFNNSTYINKVNNIKFSKKIKLKKEYLSIFIYNILQSNNITNAKIYYNIINKYYDSNITKKTQIVISHLNDNNSNTNINCKNNIIDNKTLEEIFNYTSINNFTSIKNNLEHKFNINNTNNNKTNNNNNTNNNNTNNTNNTINTNNSKTIINYYNSNIVNINNINNWLITDEKINNIKSKQTYCSISKFSNGTLNYNSNNNICFIYECNNITIDILFLNVIGNSFTLNISLNMNLDIKSNIINRHIDNIIYVLKAIDTALILI